MDGQTRDLGRERVAGVWSALLSLPYPGHGAWFLPAFQFGAGMERASVGAPGMAGPRHGGRKEAHA